MIKKSEILSGRTVKYFLLGTTSLILGLLIYLFFRPNTHISKFVYSVTSFEVPISVHLLDVPFLKFYFVDYLWAFSFSCYLHCVLKSNLGNRVCFLIVAGLGITYELSQFFEYISGTGDILDCLMYVLAVLTANKIKKGV